MTIKRLAHLCFFTNDVPRLLDFYQKAFGMTIRFDMRHDDGAAFGWYLDAGDTTFIEIFDQEGAIRQWGGEKVVLEEGSSGRYQHFCLQVEGLSDLRKELMEQGVDVTEIALGMDGSFQCWAKDPDGNAIELMEYTRDSQQLVVGRSAAL